MQVGWDFVQFDYCLFAITVLEIDGVAWDFFKREVHDIDPNGAIHPWSSHCVVLGFTSEEHRVAFILAHS